MLDEEAAMGDQLLALWRKTLGNEDLTRDDDPLMLGATSLQIMSVISQIAEQMAIDVPVEALFDAITIGDQANVLGAARQE